MLVYVDDLLITGDDIHNITLLKHDLHAAFTIKDLGFDLYFLCIELAHSSTCIILNKKKYILDILTDAGMIESSLPNFLYLGVFIY